MATTRPLDEFFDLIFCRPLGRALAKGFAKTSLTANHVSGIAGLFGIISGVCMAMPRPMPAFGGLAMLVFMILDCADGELARLKGGGGWRGRMIDGIADFVTAFSVHLGMVIWIWREGVTLYGYALPFWAVFLLGCIAGASMSWNAGVLDGLKQSLKGESIDKQAQQIVCDAKGPFDRLLWRMFQWYVPRIQRNDLGTPSYELFRRVQWVGPTHHHLWMVFAGAAAGITPYAFYAFFFVSMVPANLYLSLVLWQGRRETGRSGVIA